ncbi:hypothetical protein TNCV_3729581 [Trichonephila clavipes]|nr:hypothetical protein TNCV_3729581 [Trichonephila clavipes]
MVAAWSPAESKFSRADYLPCLHLITSDWSGTSAELPHKVRCLFEARENPMTPPNIYECNDPQPWECWHSLAEEFNPSVMGKEKRIPPNGVRIFEVLLNVPD